MTDAEILSQMRSMMVEIFDIEADRVVPEARLVEDLDLDSIDAIDMVVKLQDMTGRRVAEDELRALRTVGDVMTLIKTYLKAAP
jgi:acyl carrier protein